MSVFKKLKKGGKEEKVAVVPDPDPPKALDARIPLDKDSGSKEGRGRQLSIAKPPRPSYYRSSFIMGSGGSSPSHTDTPPPTLGTPSTSMKVLNGGLEQVVNTDPRLPFTFRDLYTLKNYWKTVRRQDKACAGQMMAKYLAQHPEQKTRYAKLKGVDLTSVDTAASNPTFEAVAGAYLKVFDDVIAAVEAKPNDANEACNRLSQVGKMHRTKVSDMDSGLFQMLEEPFLHMVSDILQDRYNEKAETLFRKFYQFCLKYLVEGFNS